MNRISHGMTECRLPAYVEEILTEHYCPYFMKMNIVRDDDNYKFSYRPGSLSRLDISQLDTYRKLTLIRSLITVCKGTGRYLVQPETYLLEPELIYSMNNKVSPDDIRILFYPDAGRAGLERKLLQFAERIRNDNIREERDIFDQFRVSIEEGDVNKAMLFLDKTILRMENRGNPQPRAS